MDVQNTQLPQLAWIAASAICIWNSACTFGSEDDLDSVYETATISVASNVGVADGLTSVEVTLTGSPNAELTMEAIAEGASFVAADNSSIREKTLFLHDLDGDGIGTATAHVISTISGVVTVALKADRIRTAQEIDFRPVRMAIGMPTPSRMVPGQTEYDVCVAINSAYGTLSVNGLSVADPDSLSAIPSFLPALVDVSTQLPMGMACPTETGDTIGWQGYAGFQWTTPIEFSQADIVYLGPSDGSQLASKTLDLYGDTFSGYDVTANKPVVDDLWTSVAVTIAYSSDNPLGGGNADGVALRNIRFIPEPGPTFLGSSSGGSGDEPKTDHEGNVVLFFDADNKSVTPGTYALFVTPEHGASVYLSDITVPDFAP